MDADRSSGKTKSDTPRVTPKKKARGHVSPWPSRTNSPIQSKTPSEALAPPTTEVGRLHFGPPLNWKRTLCSRNRSDNSVHRFISLKTPSGGKSYDASMSGDRAKRTPWRLRLLHIMNLTHVLRLYTLNSKNQDRKTRGRRIELRNWTDSEICLRKLLRTPTWGIRFCKLNMKNRWFMPRISSRPSDHIPNSRACWVSISRAGAGSRGLAAFKIRNGTLEPWNPGTLEPWNLGTPEPWNPETLEPWNPATVEPWNLGTLAPWNPQGFWNPATLEPWNLGTLQPCTPGTLLGSWNPETLEPLECLEPWKPWNPETVGPWYPGTWNPETLEPRNPGTLEPWNPGTLEPWNPGTLEPCDRGTLKPWNLGTQEPSRILEPCYLGTLEPWNPATLHTWHPAGILEPWNPWNPGNLGTLKPWDPGTLEPWNPWNPKTSKP